MRDLFAANKQKRWLLRTKTTGFREKNCIVNICNYTAIIIQCAQKKKTNSYN